MKRLLLAVCSFTAGSLIAQNVGIGTPAPSQKLEVAGAIRIGTTSTNEPGSIRFTRADSSMQAFDNTRWKSLINNFDVVGVSSQGGPAYFSSMIRNQFVNLPNLTYTIKKTGVYLILLSAVGNGSQEKNNIYNFNDNRTDYEGEIRLSVNNIPGAWYLRKKFFYTHFDAADATQDVTTPYHSDDGEKSLIMFFNQGDIIQTNAYIQQNVGSGAPAQQNPWYVEAQVKYIQLY